jgi:catechol 2,3-dioxygenase-like lactoylglutathione lyase family enzyme
MDNTIEASSRPASPVPSNHIGVGVPDLDKAVTWYHEVLGFNIVVEPKEAIADNSHFDMVLKIFSGHHLRNYDGRI